MATLSIASIVGNGEEEHFQRYLASFGQIADQFVLVTATGSKASPSLLYIDSVPVVWSEYKNTYDWPHVDDFSKARNVSFSLATSDWIMWADIDDVWEDTKENREFIRRLKADELNEYDILYLSYNVPDAGLRLLRERVFKRSVKPAWKDPVHEYCCAEGKKLLLPEAQVLHAPVGKKNSLARNLRILEHACTHPKEYPNQGPLWFYFHRELMLSGDPHRSKIAAEYALTLNLADNERYEILCNLAEMAHEEKKDSEARAMLCGALTTMPERREAYAYLARLEGESKNFRKMLAYTRAMHALPEPEVGVRTWSHKAAFYSWYGACLHAQALRMNGFASEADRWEEQVFQWEGASISVIHPTMCRANVALETHKAWMMAARRPGAIQWIFAVDAEDKYTQEALRPYRQVLCPRGRVDAVFEAIKYATGRDVVEIHDGWQPDKDWDLDPRNIKTPRPEWKLEPGYDTQYPSIIKRSQLRYIICAKEADSTNPDFQTQYHHFELGWEVNTTHVWIKKLFIEGKIGKDVTIVTLPGREFFYTKQFARVITWECFCAETGLRYRDPYPDASNSVTLDLSRWFERNWHRYPDEYFSGPGNTWGGGAWDMIQDVDEIPETEQQECDPFLIVHLRIRQHESDRNTPAEFGRELLAGLRRHFWHPIHLVGLNLSGHTRGVSGIYETDLKTMVTALRHPKCLGMLGPHSGPMGVAGLLAPKGRKLLIFPRNKCPSINANYPTGMGKCLNLNGNERRWMPSFATPAEIVKAAKEWFL